MLKNSISLKCKIIICIFNIMKRKREEKEICHLYFLLIIIWKYIKYFYQIKKNKSKDKPGNLS